MNLEMTIFQIITHSGDAKSFLFEAIHFAKSGDAAGAAAKIEEADEKLALAHKEQTKLIQTEASGEAVQISLLMVHAQDHLMNAIMFKEMAKEIVALNNRLHQLEVSQ